MANISTCEGLLTFIKGLFRAVFKWPIIICGIAADGTIIPLTANPDGTLPASGVSIPASDYTAYTYYGSTNNIETAIYKIGGSGGATVATLTFTYVGGGSADDDNVQTITKS